MARFQEDLLPAEKKPTAARLTALLREEIPRRRKAEQRLAHALNALKEARQSLAEFKALESADDSGGLAQDELLVTINHQMRSPLSALVNSLELLAHSVLSPEQMDWVNSASQAAAAMHYQLNQLRDLGQIELQGLELEESDAAIADLIDDVVDLFSAQARSERITLYGRVSPAAGIRVHCDVGRLRQILINLVAYALTFRTGDLVVLDAEREDDEMIFAVNVAPSRRTLEQLALPAGERAEGPQRVPEDPGGLGLVITHRLVELMDGRITSSMDDRAGLRLTVRLPLSLARQPRDRYLESLKDALANLNLTLLGREPDERNLALQTLERWDVKHPRIPRPRALERARRRPDLVLAQGDDTPLLRAVARRKIRSLGILDQPQRQPARDESLQCLELIRLPLSERELLEILAEPELRRFGDREATEALPLASHSAHVLVAEDSLANRMITQRMLEKLGHRPYGVADGKEAIVAARQIEFDLVLMDLKMPVVDGIEATERIIDEQGSGHPPIVAVTGDNAEGRRRECLDAGMADFLVKPVDASQLARAVERWGGEGRQRRLKKNASRHLGLPLLDRSALTRMAKQVDASLIPEIGSMFLVELEGKLRDVQRLAEGGRHGLIPKVVHPLKSSAASFGARRLAEVVKQLEKAAAAGDSELTEQYLAVIGDVAAKSSELLRSQFREMEA